MIFGIDFFDDTIEGVLQLSNLALALRIFKGQRGLV